ncbi:MAG: alkaline phosphatase [Planctomycetota bacterium]
MSTPAKPNPGVSRRSFLGASGLGAAGLLGTGLPRAKGADRPAGGTRPRNLVLMISDGMSIGALQLAELMKQQQGRGRTHWLSLIDRGDARTGLMTTDSASGPVTDSAAAGTAFSTGLRTTNGALCVLPDGSQAVPLILRARERGFRSGLVSTAYLTHATPAAFLVNDPVRGEYPRIARQMIDRGCDIALGGGTRYFTDEVLARSAAKDLRVVQSRDALRTAPVDASPMLGIFSPENMAYEIDRDESQPSLAEMTEVALAHLDALGAPFFLMVEGARIDHAAHANDAAALIHDQIAYDDALAVGLQFCDGRDDTLLISTTDHGNANPGLASYAEEGVRRFKVMDRSRHSFEWMGARLHEAGDWTPEAVGGLLSETAGVTLTDHDMTVLARVLSKKPADAYEKADNLMSVAGAILANHHGVAFCSPTHTSDHVVITSVGTGSASMPTLGHIADYHDWYTGLIGV